LNELGMRLGEGGILGDRTLERRHRIGPAAQSQVGDTELLEVRREFLEVLLISDERLQRLLRTNGPGQGIGTPPGPTEQTLQIYVIVPGGGDLAESLQSLASLLLPAEAGIALAEVEQRGEVFRVEERGPLQTRRRLREAVQAQENDAELGRRDGLGRAQLRRSLEVRESL